MSISGWQIMDDTTNGEGLSGHGKQIAGDFIPKMKFNFTVKFNYRDIPAMTGVEQGAYDMGELVLGVRQATRPNPIITYTEVNMYNYRRKVATRVDYGQTTISFYDDHHNNAHNIFKTYFETVSPIANLGVRDASDMENNSQNASIGPLRNTYGVVQAIELTHHSTEGKTVYQYINPQIVSVILDELDMTSSDSPSISLTFNCDSIHTKHVPK